MCRTSRDEPKGVMCGRGGGQEIADFRQSQTHGTLLFEVNLFISLANSKKLWRMGNGPPPGLLALEYGWLGCSNLTAISKK